MTTHPYLHVSEEGRRAVVVIDNPPVNALSFEVLDSLVSTLDHLVVERGIRAVVLTGEGRFFCAGADIRELDTMKTAGSAKAMMLKAHAQLDRIEALAVPVIAAINGACLGGGNELAMACHLRIAAESAKLGQPEINLGLIPGFGGSQRLPRLVGKARAMEMLLTGDPVTAKEALEMGLVGRVVPDDHLMHEAMALADRITGKGRAAVTAILHAVRMGMEGDIVRAKALEAELFGRLCESADKDEGVRAFLEKRKARFS